MGFAGSWIAVRGRSPSELLGRLDLVDTGEAAGDRIVTYALTQSPKDWLVILSSLYDFANPARLAEVSIGTEALGVQVEEHVMVIRIWVYRDGVEQWSLTHDPELGMDHAAITGSPPDWLGPIVDRLKADRAADGGDESMVDFVFEAPLEASVTLCGFRHDDNFEGEDHYPDFRVLRPTGSVAPQQKAPARSPVPPPAPASRPQTPTTPRRGFLSWLFGRR